MQRGGGYTGVCQAVRDPQEAGFKLLSFSRLREESGGQGEGNRGQDSGMGGMSSIFQVCVFTCLLSIGSLRERWEWGKGGIHCIYVQCIVCALHAVGRAQYGSERQMGRVSLGLARESRRALHKNQEI